MRYREYIVELDDLKRCFLNYLNDNYDIKETTFVCYERMFRRITDFEKLIEKSLEDFNDKDLAKFLRYLGSSSEYVIDAYLGLIKNYISFIKDNNKGGNNIDFSRALSLNDWKLFVDKTKKDNKYVTRKDLINKLHKLGTKIDVSDKSLILCIFEGIRGKNNSSLIHLKKSDINFKTNEVRIIEYDEEKIITISDELKVYLLRTCNATDYEYYSRKNPEKKCEPLINSEYVFRPCGNYENNGAVQKNIYNGNITGESLSTQSIARRVLGALRNYCDLPYVTLTTLYTSGIFQKIFDSVFDDESYDKDKSFQNNFVIQAQKIGVNRQTAYKLSSNIDLLKDKFYEYHYTDNCVDTKM